jgi:hypothetical protein
MLKNFKPFLPRSLRFAIFRGQLTLPSVEDNPLIFKPAETEYEFRSAFSVLHDCYVEFQYMKADKSGLRVTPYHLLHNTVTLIVKKENEVIGTVSIVRDNPLGLPMDKIFDLSHFRQSGRRIGEISALAIHKDFRGKKGAVLHLIMRYLWKFTQEYLNLEYFVCAVNPSMNELWESVYLFKPLTISNRVKSYDFAKGAPAIGLFVPVSGSFPLWESQYKKHKTSGNLYNFINKPFCKNEYHFLNRYYAVIRNSMSKKLRERFLADSLANLQTHLSMAEKIKLFCQLNNVGVMELDFLAKSIGLKSRSERFDVFCELIGVTNSPISDVSKTGLKINPTSWIKDKAPDFLSIQIGPGRVSRVRTELVWKNKFGVTGHKIIDADKSWEDFISYLQEEPNFCEEELKVG